jgi:hypothetical protein
MSMIPSQKLGTDCPIRETTEIAPSIGVRCFSAARIPSGKLNNRAITTATAASRPVAAIRFRTSSPTGRFSHSDSPKSSRAASAR